MEATMKDAKLIKKELAKLNKEEVANEETYATMETGDGDWLLDARC